MYKKYYERQGAQLREWRHQAGLTIEEVTAGLISRGIPLKSYSVANIENGASTMYNTTWPHYMIVLGRPGQAPLEYFKLKDGTPKPTRERLEPQVLTPGEFPKRGKVSRTDSPDKIRAREAKAKLKERMAAIARAYREATADADAEYLRRIEPHAHRRLVETAPARAIREKAEAEAKAEYEAALNPNSLEGIL